MPAPGWVWRPLCSQWGRLTEPTQCKCWKPVICEQELEEFYLGTRCEENLGWKNHSKPMYTWRPQACVDTDNVVTGALCEETTLTPKLLSPNEICRQMLHCLLGSPSTGWAHTDSHGNQPLLQISSFQKLFPSQSTSIVVEHFVMAQSALGQVPKANFL